ncbi:MAG: HlyD family secretion protein [Desulfuromonadaceae bacterium]|nr:HlyD family secretion protein [Desulfuromonadaceae bacterium]MDD2849236.1 HlyD family secretion protein [Desulfuromonadaceae bacterium]MDD4129715.1 HlyD family secretion protein [Desulfuromonadaceae bacterium]
MEEETTVAVTEPAETEPEVKNGGNKKIRAVVILLTVILVGGWFGLRWFISSRTDIETDNAFIEARILSVSSKVSGTVARVLVVDNQFVKQGDLLLEIDERDYQFQVAKAAAGVGMAENESGGEQLKAEAVRATVQSARARFEQAVLDQGRAERLYRRDVLPKEQLDRTTTARRVAEAQLKEAEEALKRARTEAGLASGSGNKAKILQSKAQLGEAELRLSYTKIYAPRDGYITRKAVEAGVNIQAGQPLMALVPLQDAWITANYKERQLTWIKPGQKVEFSVDAYPGKIFGGTVDSIMAGTGAAFSLLPPENATGNYVKVVQRVPVKITIDRNSDPEQLLRVGMSVIPVVLTGRTSGDVLSEMLPFK